MQGRNAIQWAAGAVVAAMLVMPGAIYGAAGPCKDDIAKFCKGLKRGQGRIAKCLKEHESELSDLCKQHVASRGKGKRKADKQATPAVSRQAQRAACSDDLEKFCKDVKPGEGRIAKCLKEHESELSAACKDSLAAAKTKTKKPKKGKKQKKGETPQPAPTATKAAE